jgi:hypothetical protein
MASIQEYAPEDLQTIEDHVLNLYHLLPKREPDEFGRLSWCAFISNAGPEGLRVPWRVW